MKRRRLLATIPLLGIAAGGSHQAITGLWNRASKVQSSGTTDVFEKAKNAMPSMQSATWEQGVARLESGDHGLVIFVAKDAVLSQSQDGRLAMLGEEFSMSDAACRKRVDRRE